MYQGALVGTVIRYIAGRNAVQTVYWRTSVAPNSKMVKVSKVFHLGNTKAGTSPPVQMQTERNIKFN